MSDILNPSGKKKRVENMETLILRDVKQEDLTTIKELINEAWKLEVLTDDEETKDAALGMYINDVLHRSSYGKVATIDGNVIGCIFGSVLTEEPTCRLVQENSAEITLKLLNTSLRSQKDISEFVFKTFATHKRLYLDMNKNYDGCLEFFVVNEEFRGLSIGKKLWYDLKNYFKLKNAKSIYLFSDTDSNYGFYEHNGLTKQQEIAVTFDYSFGKSNQTQFIFDGNISE